MNKSLRSENSENISNTPLRCLNANSKHDEPVTPLQLKTFNSLAKRRNYKSISFNKEDGLLKKKKLEFFESSCTDNTTSLKNNKSVLSTSLSDEKIPLSQNIETLFDDKILQEPDFITEMQRIEFFKQKNLHKRVQNGLKVKPGMLKKTNFKSPQDLFGDDCIPASQLPRGLGFKLASKINCVSSSNMTKSNTDKEEHSVTISVSSTNAEKINDLNKLITIWRRGLRDSIEYLSCLAYPPTDVEEIMRHFNISSDWLKD